MSQEKVGNKLFYDTYTLYAIATGEESYKDFVKGFSIITTLMNLYELYYVLIKDNRKDLAKEFFNHLINNCVDIKPDDVKGAAELRFEEIRRKLSYLDCLGYIVAKNRGVKFLTGDAGFDGLSNVKFVK